MKVNYRLWYPKYTVYTCTYNVCACVHHEVVCGSGGVVPRIILILVGGEWSASRLGRITPRQISRYASVVIPSRCTSVSNLFILEWHYVFRAVFPSIVSKTVHTATKQILLTASGQQYLFDKCLLLYVQSLTPDDGRKDRPKHVVSFQNK